jgi:branched-chain amino acid transport system permease protein
VIEYILRGLLNGAVYALLALPMSLLFSTAGTIDFAVGGYALLAAAVASTVSGPLGLAAGLAAGVAASAIMALVFALLKRAGEAGIRIALASFGLSVALSSFVLLVWGTQPFVRSTYSTFLEVFGLRVSPQGLINLVIALVLVGGVQLLLLRTGLGRMLRAAAASPLAAELAGIAVLPLQCATVLAGGLLSGVAGLLIVYSSGLDFTASLSLTFIGFAAAIVFGIKSPIRSLLGGFAIGIIEALSAGYTSGLVTAMVPAVCILVFLIAAQLLAPNYTGDRP